MYTVFVLVQKNWNAVIVVAINLNAISIQKKRKAAEKKMNTAEMYIKANENGKTYYSESVDAFYSKEFGLVEAEDTTQKVQIGDFPTFEYLMQREWEEVKAMTKAEAEKKYKIRIVD